MTPGRAYALALIVMAAGVACLIVGLGLPWLTLAVVGGVVATRSWARTVVAALLLCAGVASAIVPWAIGSGSVLSVVGGVLVAAGAAWTMARGRAWPTLGARYDRASAQRREARPVSTWDAQDRGIDPTADDAA